MRSVVIMNGNLRLHDNPALHAAAKEGETVLVYLLDLQARALGKNQQWWLDESLKALGKSAKLVVRAGDPASAIKKLLGQSKADSIYWNDSFNHEERRFYRAIEKVSIGLGVDVFVGEANHLVDPEELSSGSGGYYKVFSAFWKRSLSLIEPSKPLPAPKIACSSTFKSDSMPSIKGGALDQYWSPGEEGARKQFKKFCSKGLGGYAGNRDRVDLDGTSMLSPHLRWGEISVREIWHTLKGRSATAFLREMGFRDFAYYVMYHFPKLPRENFGEKFNRFPWKSGGLSAWKGGKTGFPIVDAGMTQLVEMGWMHNRARMIVASFLTKDLQIDWRKGERFFWDQLVDGDPAINAYNWQWVAGTGIDAAPFFRIFNPETQSKKFDPQGNYVSEWIPDIDEEGYPEPIVDHDVARKEALDKFKTL